MIDAHRAVVAAAVKARRAAPCRGAAIYWSTVSTAHLLERHPLLSRLALAQIERVAACGELETFEAGEVIVAEGGLGDALYLVLTGQVQVSKNAHPLATLPPGEFFGEMSLVEPAPRSATVTAVETSFLFRLPSVALQKLAEDDPAAWSAILVQIVKTLSERLRHANHLLTSVGELAEWLAGSLV
jgi:CRP/FNR family cyclic AMP-dependent transcriptional regulator